MLNVLAGSDQTPVTCYFEQAQHEAGLHELGLQSERQACVVCSFAATERYLVLVVWPETMNPLKLLITQNFCESAQWKPEKGVTFHVIDKRKHGPGVVATYV